MALGDYACGTGPCGFDPSVTTDRVLPTRPKALLFDLATRQSLLDEDGYAESTHPVDQEVALAIGVEKGTLPSSPDTGFDYERLRRVPTVSLSNAADDEVRLTLKRAIGAGDIRIDRIEVERRAGRILLAVQYTNLRTGAPVRAENR